jgi:hypothetical protein
VLRLYLRGAVIVQSLDGAPSAVPCNKTMDHSRFAPRMRCYDARLYANSCERERSALYDDVSHRPADRSGPGMRGNASVGWFTPLMLRMRARLGEKCEASKGTVLPGGVRGTNTSRCAGRGRCDTSMRVI